MSNEEVLTERERFTIFNGRGCEYRMNKWTTEEQHDKAGVPKLRGELTEDDKASLTLDDVFKSKEKYIGIITDEYDNDSIGHNISSDVDDMLRWKKGMVKWMERATTLTIKKCMIYKINPHHTKYGNE